MKKFCFCGPVCFKFMLEVNRLTDWSYRQALQAMDWNTGCWLVAFAWCTILWLLVQIDEQDETHAVFLFMVSHHYSFGAGPLNRFHFLSFVYKNNYVSKNDSWMPQCARLNSFEHHLSYGTQMNGVTFASTQTWPLERRRPTDAEARAGPKASSWGRKHCDPTWKHCEADILCCRLGMQ